jgi:hypothetical protein
VIMCYLYKYFNENILQKYPQVDIMWLESKKVGKSERGEFNDYRVEKKISNYDTQRNH